MWAKSCQVLRYIPTFVKYLSWIYETSLLNNNYVEAAESPKILGATSNKLPISASVLFSMCNCKIFFVERHPFCTYGL